MQTVPADWPNIPGLSWPDIPNIPSPRDDLLNNVLNSMLNPQPTDLVVQSYFDKLAFFVVLALSLWVLQFFVSAAQGIMKGDLAARMRSWAFSGMFLLIVVPLLPAMIVGTQVMFNVLGKHVFQLMLGADNVKEGIAAVSQLTGNPGLDLVLSVAQIGILVALAIELKLVIVALYVSVIALIVAVALKFLGDFGEKVFASALGITLFGVAGNAVVLVVMGLVVGFGTVAFNDDNFARGLINTGAFFVALICLSKILSHIGGRIKATAAAGSQGLRNARGRIQRNDSGYESDGGDRQATESAKTHRRHFRRDRPDSKTSSDSTGDNNADRTAGGGYTERRSSSVLARSQSRGPQTAERDEHPRSPVGDSADSTDRKPNPHYSDRRPSNADPSVNQPASEPDRTTSAPSTTTAPSRPIHRPVEEGDRHD